MARRRWRAREWAKFPSPAAVVERAKRLYVASPLIEAGAVSLRVDTGLNVVSFAIDVQQGADAVLSVGAKGFVLAGLDSEAEVWERDRKGVAAPASMPRPLRSVLASQRPGWEGISFLYWAGPAGKAWRAAPGMFAGGCNDLLRLGDWFVMPEGDLVDELVEYSDFPEVRRLVAAVIGKGAEGIHGVLKRAPERCRGAMSDRALAVFGAEMWER